jgi:hypothetical protein
MYKRAKDLTAQRFGFLIANKIHGKTKDEENVVWECSCDCGKISFVVSYRLTNGTTKSCGCKRKTNFKRKIKDISGEKFNRLTVIRKGKSVNRKTYWLCKCECGNETEVEGYSLKIGNTKSCGCLNRENFLGKNNPNYNPSLTIEDRVIGRKYPEYTEWRKAVYERDGYSCQICKDKSGGNLNAHHLDGYTDNPDKRILLSNGITLCDRCHKNFHHQFGNRNNTVEQFNKFTELLERG